ncbi:MAG TPA: OmpA family protein [Gemmatimonadaceae bacterium]|nr:OmpA family protein [Gemmatimonadaceae bacterium]
MALPAGAQVRGTMEFGAFGSAASFDRALTMTNAYGGGGRVGMYLDPRWSVEFEMAEMRASRTGGLADVNVGILSSRLVAVPARIGRLSLLLGVGAGVSTETNFLHSYGVDALAGAKFALSENAALRVDGVWDWLANENYKQYQSVRVGVSLYRRPAGRTTTVTQQVAGPAMMHADSVSAAETRRLRASDAALRALRDSLRNRSVSPSAADVATMQAEIRFAFDKAELTDEAKAILDAKVEVFRANPEMIVSMVGKTDVVGTDAYNMALGARRADAAKAYLVMRGVDARRIVAESKGEGAQIANSAGAAGEASNRRAVFRVFITQEPR